MKRKMKITISALAVMFVAAIAVAIASFSFAGNGDKDDLLEDSEILADASGSVGEKTIIDYIIENSNSTDPDIDKVYHIAEITSSGTPSSLDTYVSSNGFKDYVLDGNKTIEQLMAEGCVEYKPFSGSLAADKNSKEYKDALEYISKADLIYVSNDSANKFSKTNDISEDLYDILHQYAVGDYKPLIIDNPTASSVDNDDSKTMNQLAKDVFGPNEKYYYTFKWAENLSAADYLSHVKGSLYLGINGKTQKENGVWTTVYATQPTIDADGTVTSPNPSSIAKVLTISTDGTSARTDLLLQKSEGKNPEVTTPVYTVADNNGTKTAQEYTVAAGSKLYELSADSIFYTNGYNNRVSVRPQYIQNDIVTLDQASTDDVDFDQYDMIVIEDNCNSAVISNTLYKKFASAMYGKLHVVYSEKMGTGSQQSAEDIKDKRETNYLDLFYLVATSDYIEKYQNIMVTNRADFSVITTSSSAKTAKVIADLINASKYRGIGGSSSSSSMFTVLELQPCYPVDDEVAAYNGTHGKPRSGKGSEMYGSANYYTSPGDMINGKTKEQLPENTEYYKWELSKAKLADALGIDYDKINLVQMSTSEFAGDKTEILGTYDMVYIGGNTTALKGDAKYYKFLCSQYLGHNNGNLSVDQIAHLPIYTMYSHNGDLVQQGKPNNQNLNGSKLTAYVTKNGNTESTITYLNGNDITYNRYTALKEYVEKGMPVVVSKKLTDAYNLTKGLKNKYLQNSIDPDSNMYKLLTACDAQTTASTKNPTVVWGLNQDAVVDVVADGTLGDSQTGYVSIFAQGGAGSVSESNPTAAAVVGNKELFKQVYNAASKRPKLVVSKMPVEYNRFDDSTRLTSRKLSFKYDVINSTSYTANLYVDDDGNGKFNKANGSSEFLTSSDTNTLTYECPDSFFGPVYWMLEIVDNNTGISVNQTGFSYIKNSENKKQDVSVLQIMPVNGGGTTGWDSLYFCTECQRSINILEYNPTFPQENREAFMAYYGGKYTDSKDTKGTFQRGNTTIYIGKHKHTFGINAYDSTLTIEGRTGVDNFDVNLADEINDLYNFDLDIVRRDEFEKMSNEVRAAYEYVVDEDGNITNTLVSDAVKRTEVLTGPDKNSVNYADYFDVKKPYLQTALAKLTKTEIEQKVKAQLKANNPDLTDAQIDDRYKRITEDEILSMLDGELSESFNQDTINILYVAKKKCDYANKAAEYKSVYDEKKADTEDKQAQLDAVIDAVIANSPSRLQYTDLNGKISQDKWKSELTRLKTTGYYSDYYTICNSWPKSYDITTPILNASGKGTTVTYKKVNTDGTTESVQFTAKEIDSFISSFYHAQDAELDANSMYKFYTRLAGGTKWIEACYSTVSLGPAECFGRDDITDENALDDLETYVKDNNQIVVFHDTMSMYADQGASKLTERLRSYFGMDRYGNMQTDAEVAEQKAAQENGTTYKQSTSNPKITDKDSSYVRYTSSDSDKYFMTNLSYIDKSDDSRYATCNSDLQKNAGIGISGYLTDVAYTDAINVADDGMGNTYAMPFKYADPLNFAAVTVAIQDTQFERKNFEGKYATNKASQNNKGFVTTFPFTIASELYVGPTHQQAYAVNLEDDDMTVWYSLAGGDSSKECSSMLAASPRDAMNNYFLYSYKNVFYCGAGHSDILGAGKDNNDERYLFINILCNSVRQSLDQPNIKVFDYDETETKEDNNVIKKDSSNGYVMKVKEDETYPEFNFKITTDSTTTLSNVKIFYDLDYKNGNTDSAYGDGKNKNHILIADWNSQQVVAGQNKHVFRYNPNLKKLANASGGQIEEEYVGADGKTVKVAATTLKLLPEYFAPYNNEYTYIVIQATDSKGQVVYQRIKIKAVPHLFDLT